MTGRRTNGAAAAALALATLAGCATVDPSATVEATSRTLAEKGVSGVEWRRDPEAADQAQAYAARSATAPGFNVSPHSLSRGN